MKRRRGRRRRRGGRRRGRTVDGIEHVLVLSEKVFHRAPLSIGGGGISACPRQQHHYRRVAQHGGQ